MHSGDTFFNKSDEHTSAGKSLSIYIKNIFQ